MADVRVVYVFISDGTIEGSSTYILIITEINTDYSLKMRQTYSSITQQTYLRQKHSDCEEVW